MTRLRDLIEESGRTQTEVAVDLGYQRVTFGHYVRNDREIDHAGICKVCDYFGCTADYLLGRSSARLPAVSEEDAELIRVYNSLPLEIRRAVDGLMAPYRTTEEKKAL